MQFKTIHKFTLSRGITNTFRFPVGSSVVKAGEQQEQETIWVECPRDSANYEDRSFSIFGTNWAVPSDAIYIDTIVSVDGHVWHIYEVK